MTEVRGANAMDFSQYFASVEILKQSMKLLMTKNTKLMAFATALSLLSSSIFFFLFAHESPASFMRDMLVRESLFPISSSITAEFISKREGQSDENVPYLFTLLFFGYLLSYSIVSFFPMMAAIVVSADSYNIGSSNLSIKELCLKILRSWSRPFLTALCTTIFAVGYAYSVFYVATPLPVFSELSNLKHAVLFCVAAYIFYLYISSAWILSLVVSVVEEDGGGFSALGRSAEIIRGQKMSGFLLNIVLNLISLAVYLCWSLMKKHDMIFGLVVVNVSCLVRILTFVVYTVLYFRGKELVSNPFLGVP